LKQNLLQLGYSQT